jgi:prepilin-type N-terminal cleavage/methylation domain-containing protein
MNKKGFTLIELLVVIAIIGILSSVVLASLNSARNKGAIANVKSNLNSMRAQSAIFYDDTSNTYTGLCTNATIVAASSSAAAGASYIGCTASDPQKFSILAVFKTAETGGSAWCVDSNGYSGYSASTTVTAGTVCK